MKKREVAISGNICNFLSVPGNSFIAGTADLPVSFVLDTLLLPFDLTSYYGNRDAKEGVKGTDE